MMGRRLWRQFTVEIAGLILAGLGMFLLLERMQIWVTLLGSVRGLLLSLAQAARDLTQGLLRAVGRVTVSDAIGGVVIAAAVWLILWRVRWRIAHSEVLASRVCPHCRSRLYRVHRRNGDRLITWIVPLRRYRCAGRDCRRTGLKLRPRRTRSGRCVNASQPVAGQLSGHNSTPAGIAVDNWADL
jgi:hypothetical protein